MSIDAEDTAPPPEEEEKLKEEDGPLEGGGVDFTGAAKVAAAVAGSPLPSLLMPAELSSQHIQHMQQLHSLQKMHHDGIYKVSRALHEGELSPP